LGGFYPLKVNGDLRLQMLIFYPAGTLFCICRWNRCYCWKTC